MTKKVLMLVLFAPLAAFAAGCDGGGESHAELGLELRGAPMPSVCEPSAGESEESEGDVPWVEEDAPWCEVYCSSDGPFDETLDCFLLVDDIERPVEIDPTQGCHDETDPDPTVLFPPGSAVDTFIVHTTTKAQSTKIETVKCRSEGAWETLGK